MYVFINVNEAWQNGKVWHIWCMLRDADSNNGAVLLPLLLYVTTSAAAKNEPKQWALEMHDELSALERLCVAWTWSL